MKKVSLFFAVIAMFAFASCGGGSKINLADKGIPVTFSAPEGAEVKKGFANGDFDGVVYVNYEVKIGDSAMDILMEDIDITNDLATCLDFAKEIETTGDNFVKFIKEEENGYIAKLRTDDGDNYAFGYIIIKDKRAIEFSEVNFEDYTLAEIKTLYNTAKSAK